METGLIVELVSTLGFPIAMVVAMCFLIWNIYKQSIAREGVLMNEIAENRIVNAKAIETIALYAERLTHIEDNVLTIKNDVNMIKDKIQE